MAWEFPRGSTEEQEGTSAEGRGPFPRLSAAQAEPSPASPSLPEAHFRVRFLQDGRVVSRAPSGGLGYAVGESIASAYLLAAVATPGVKLEVDGACVPAMVQREPRYDSTHGRIKS